jgi:hypothetical protein
MALASDLVTAVDDQEQVAAGLSNAMPALLPPTIDCHRKLPDGRLCHRNRPFVLVGATDWVCPKAAYSHGLKGVMGGMESGPSLRAAP